MPEKPVCRADKTADRGGNEAIDGEKAPYIIRVTEICRES